MTTLTIEQRVTRVITEQLMSDDIEVTPTAHFTDDLGADSLDLIEMVMAVENEFDITIPDEEAEKITTLQQAVDYVKAHVPERP